MQWWKTYTNGDNHCLRWMLYTLSSQQKRMLQCLCQTWMDNHLYARKLSRRAFVYFSSPITGELVAHIKKGTRVFSRIGALSEMNLEYCAIDSQVSNVGTFTYIGSGYYVL
uniref:Uncharacterized protein n=1 Tax=Opuntia streptacantha TaxID=393608 RepID=A0A7C9EXP3_OPUST